MKINMDYWNSLTRNQHYYSDMDERLFPMLQQAGFHTFTYQDEKYRLWGDKIEYIPKGKKRPIRTIPRLVFDKNGYITWELILKPKVFDKETVEVLLNYATERIEILIKEKLILMEEYND